MTVKQLIEVLKEMDPERVVISTVEPGKEIRGVGTMVGEVEGREVAVIR